MQDIHEFCMELYLHVSNSNMTLVENFLVIPDTVYVAEMCAGINYAQECQ